MSNNINTKPMTGFMELLPEQQRAFNKMLKIIREVYDLFGFRPIETPLLERAEVLLTKGGGETDKQIYRFQKGDNDIALRFDLTVPLARYVTEYQNELIFPFKVGNIGKVYRGEKSQAGRFREFYQCDMDVIGRDSLDLCYDAEVVAMACEIFNRFGFEKFKVKLNNRKILNGFFDSLDLSDQITDILRILDKLDKKGEQFVREEFNSIGISSNKIDSILNFISINENVIENLEKLKISNQKYLDGIKELRIVLDYLPLLGVDANNYQVDLTIARGLDYYTGTVYETILTDYPQFGSVCSGGRYDDLASYYTDNKFPGVGLSIGLTRLFDCLLENDLIEANEMSSTKVLVTGMPQYQNEGLKVVNILRGKNVNCEVMMGFKAGMKYADRMRIPYVVILGEEEVSQGKYGLKDMISGEQKMVEIDELFDELI